MNGKPANISARKKDRCDNERVSGKSQPGTTDGEHGLVIELIEGRIVKDDVRKTVKDRQSALDSSLKAIREFRKYTDEPLTLRGSDYAHAVQELNKAIDRADGILT